MVPGSRNPMWGEEFNFAVEELPVEVVIVSYDSYHSYSCGSRKHSCGTIFEEISVMTF